MVVKLSGSNGERGAGAAKRCRVAFVGAGSMIREHIRAFADVDGAELAGITNRTRARAELLATEFALPHVCDTIDELWDRTRADLVVMAVYEPAIKDVALRCLRHPWAVFMEKPIGLDLADAQDVALAATVAQRRVWVGLNRRMLSSTRHVLDDLAGDLGVRFLHVQDQQSLETARALGHQEEVVRNWMFANSIHLVDYFMTFGRGEVRSVDRIVPFDAAAPTVVLAKVAFSSGDIGLYVALWSGPGPWSCTVTTARRRWELRPLERATFQNAGERNLNSVEPASCDTTFKPGFRLQAEHVVAAWRGESSDVATLSEAMATTKLVHEIYSC